MDFVKNALEDIGIAGQLLLLYLFLRGPYRRYYLFFTYFVVEMLSTFADEYVIRAMGRRSTQFHNVYFGGEMIGDLLLLVVVILFTYQVMEDSHLRDQVRKILLAVAAGAIILPFIYLSGDRFSTTWYNGTIQLFNFGAAIMTLALWTALIARKKRDPQLMLICAGLGIAVAGNAALWGMRKLTTGEARAAANLLIQIMYLIRIGIWCWAFRPRGVHAAPVAPVAKISVS